MKNRIWIRTQVLNECADILDRHKVEGLFEKLTGYEAFEGHGVTAWYDYSEQALLEMDKASGEILSEHGYLCAVEATHSNWREYCLSLIASEGRHSDQEPSC